MNWLSKRLEVNKEITVMLQMLTIFINVNMVKEDNIIMISVTFWLLSRPFLAVYIGQNKLRHIKGETVLLY